MKFISAIILTVTLWGGFNDIATINSLKKQAKEAYNKGDYEAALSQYKLLTDSLGISDESLKLNLANTYYKLNDTTKAVNAYSNLLASNDRSVKSVAHQQLGIIKNRAKQFEEALSHFKESLKADPTNNDSRYNYELLKKVLEEQKQNQQQNKDQNQDQKNKDQQQKDKQDQQNKDQQKQDQENKDQKNQDQKDQQDKNKQDQENKEGEQEKDKDKQGQEEDKKEGEEKKDEQKPEPKEGEQNDDKQQSDKMPSLSDKLKEMKISEEKAKMILEAMKNNEIQYIQQNKRKATKKKDPDKPDW